MPWLPQGALGLLLAVCATVASAQVRWVNIAVDDAHPPYSYAVADRSAGSDVALVEMALQEMPGWRVRWLPRPWARALEEARQGVVDAFMPPFKEVDREWAQVFAGPLHVEQVVLSCGMAVTIGAGSRWPDDFKQLRIGTVRGYLLGHELSGAFSQGFLAHSEFRNARDALAALAAAEIDCYADDLVDIQRTYEQAMADKVWAPRMPRRLEAPFTLTTQKAYVGFSRQSLAQRPELAEFAKLLNARLAALRADGEAERLLSLELGSK